MKSVYTFYIILLAYELLWNPNVGHNDSNELDGEKKKETSLKSILYVSNTHYVLYDDRVL